jgi:hypothetical protein
MVLYAATATPVRQGVGGDAVQPGAEMVAHELAVTQFRPGFEKDLLRQVFRDRRLCRAGQQPAKDSRPIIGHQPTERLAFSGSGPVYQLRFLRPIHRITRLLNAQPPTLLATRSEFRPARFRRHAGNHRFSSARKQPQASFAPLGLAVSPTNVALVADRVSEANFVLPGLALVRSVAVSVMAVRVSRFFHDTCHDQMPLMNALERLQLVGHFP